MMSVTNSPAMKVGKYKGDKTCLCGHPEECRGLTAAFVLLKDGRKGFVKLPNWKDDPPSQYYVERNQQRESYLRHLLPGHPVPEPTPTKNIALHHFHPKVTGRFLDQRQKEIPKTITEEEMAHLGLPVDDCDRVIDEYGFPTGECIFVPNYPMQKVKDDLKRMILINRIVNEALMEEQEKRQQQAREDAAERERLDQEQKLEEPAGPSPLEALTEAPDNERRKTLYMLLESWETERRRDYSFLLESKTAEWKGSIDFLEDGVTEIARAERLVLGAALADQAMAEAMHAISHDSYLDDEHNAVTEAWKENRLMKQRQEEWMPTEMMHPLVEAKTRIGAKFMEAAEYGTSEIGKELTVFREEMEVEVSGLQTMGDALLREMEASEKEVQSTWFALHAIIFTETQEESPEVSRTASQDSAEKEAETNEEGEEKENGVVEDEVGPEEPSKEEDEAEAELIIHQEFSFDDVSVDDEKGGEANVKTNDDSQDVEMPEMSRKEAENAINAVLGADDDEEEDAANAKDDTAEGADYLSPLSGRKNRAMGFFKSLSERRISPQTMSTVATKLSTESTLAMFDASPVSATLRKLTNVKDVWVRESLYREAARHQAKVWHTCLGLLSKLNGAIKEIELERSVKLHAMLLDFLPRERRLFLGLPPVPKPVMEKLMEFRLDEGKMEENIDEALHKRSRIVLRVDNAQRSSIMNRSRCVAPDLTKTFDKPLEGDSFVTHTMRYTTVLERKVAGKGEWKTTWAVVTADYYLHLFDAPDSLPIGTSPHDVYAKLVPRYDFPTNGETILATGPRVDKLLKDLIPVETINLLNCSAKVLAEDQVELTETIAGRFKGTKKFVLKANEETLAWQEILNRRPEDEESAQTMVVV